MYLVSDYSQLVKLDIVYKNHKNILDKYWPGPITFIMNSINNTVGLRMPDWDVLKIIIKQAFELMTPSFGELRENDKLNLEDYTKLKI